jgi:hypothetical protein
VTDPFLVEEILMPSNVMQKSEILGDIRTAVKDHLERNPTFAAMPESERRDLAQNTVTALAYILGGEDGHSRPEAVSLADKPALPINPAQHTKQDFKDLTTDESGKTAGQKFKESGAVAADQGTDDYTKLVSKVDFPSFVGGLIKGVFDAINNSTMAQLKAYSELVKNVAKSVEEFMQDNVSENHARDYLVQKFPNQLDVDTSGGKPTLIPKADADEENMPAMFKDLGLPADNSVDESTIEEKLVPAARRRMALDRQQLLATMVMMGVNRLVVTNGTIEASVLFELKTKDEVRRGYRQTGNYGGQQSASNYDNRATTTDSSSGGGFWGAIFGGDSSNTHDEWYRGHYDSDNAQFSVSTTRSEDSSAKVDLHAKLTGKVNVNFKSDYFPMEKMTDVLSMNAIKEKAMGDQAVEIARINAGAKAAANALPAAPPAPPIPGPAATAPAHA